MTEKKSESKEKRKKILIVFNHGLGDCMQLQIVLRHLTAHGPLPLWDIDVAIGRGKAATVRDHCRRVFEEGVDAPPDIDAYDKVLRLDWHENHTPDEFPAVPQTKPAKCLREVFGYAPDESLFYHIIGPNDEEAATAKAYLRETVGSRKTLVLHYQGNTSAEKKNLPHELAAAICSQAKKAGWAVVILDWDGRTTLADGVDVFNPGADHPLWRGAGTGDAGILSALIKHANLFLGVDSGPLHVAAGCSRNYIGVWLEHLPIQFMDDQAGLHLVPSDWRDRPPCAGHPETARFMEGYYRLREYRAEIGLHDGAGDAILDTLHTLMGGPPGPPPQYSRWRQGALTATDYEADYYLQHKVAGLDYLGFGDWQREYGRWFVESLGLRRKQVLDAGCACGSIVRGIGEAGAYVAGVDISRHMIHLGKKRWPDMSPILKVGDVADLSEHWEANTFDCIHSAQSAEHWDPEQIPAILREFRRITRRGGLLWVALDTTELYLRQSRDPKTEDPTHVCIRPMDWWRGQLKDAGWVWCTESVADRMGRHPDSFFKRYDWDWFAAINPGDEPTPADLAETITWPATPLQLFFEGVLRDPGHPDEHKTSQQLTENLAVGSFLHIPHFEAAGWRVLTVAHASPEPTNGRKIALIDGTGNSLAKARECVEWILAEWQAGNKVFVCCRSGANRSPALCAAALALSGQFGGIMSSAYEWLRSQRSKVGYRHGTAEEIERAVWPLLVKAAGGQA